MRAFLSGLLASLSIVAGYLPVAFSFGLAAVQAGLSPATTLLTSIIVYAGASQFVLITLLASGAGLLTAIPTVLLMNARHLFYGPALLGRFTGQGTKTHTPLLAFGLTDEVFATAMSKLNSIAPDHREHWYLGLQLGAYSAWVSGTLLGTMLSDSFQDPPIFVREALAFVLPSLFFALLLDSGIRHSARTIVVSVAVTALLGLWLPSYHALALGMLIGALFNMVTARR